MHTAGNKAIEQQLYLNEKLGSKEILVHIIPKYIPTKSHNPYYYMILVEKSLSHTIVNFHFMVLPIIFG